MPASDRRESCGCCLPSIVEADQGAACMGISPQDIQDADGISPVSMAIVSGAEEVACVLLDAGEH